VGVDLFQKVLFAAAKDASREVRILEKMSHPADHPVSLYHPEGEYLKAFLLQVR
jgi:23S rRNA (cytosine1962-C5)-methyltransferase